MRIIGSPCLALRVVKTSGWCKYESAAFQENLQSNAPRMTLASAIAKFCPTHERGPRLKGMNAPGLSGALLTPFANRLGLNSAASGPQSFGLLCMACKENKTSTQLKVPQRTRELLQEDGQWGVGAPNQVTVHEASLQLPGPS